MTTAIEYARREELPQIAALINSAWRSAYAGILSPEYLSSLSDDERSTAFLKRYDSEQSHFLAMRDGSELIGTAVFGKSTIEGYCDDGEVSALYLRHNCIGKGYGHNLFTCVERALAADGYTNLILNVLAANARAIRFYKAHGYRQVDERLLTLGGIQYPYLVLRKQDEIVAFGLTLAELWQLFPIQLAEHESAWREWYDDEAASLNAVLGDVIERIDHIGSTAIDGLLAKPIVDILLQIADGCNTADLKDRLAADGWLLMAEQTRPYLQLDYNKGYTPQGFAERVYHLHIRNTGDWDELHFRDYIRAHPEVAAEYAALKRQLLASHEFDRDAYTEAKGDFIKDCVAKAREG